MTTFMMVGFLAVIASTVVYFGLVCYLLRLSKLFVQAVISQQNARPCRCMYALQSTLTLDRDSEGKEFDEKYNKKSYKS